MNSSTLSSAVLKFDESSNHTIRWSWEVNWYKTEERVFLFIWPAKSVPLYIKKLRLLFIDRSCFHHCVLAWYGDWERLKTHKSWNTSGKDIRFSSWFLRQVCDFFSLNEFQSFPHAFQKDPIEYDLIVLQFPLFF